MPRKLNFEIFKERSKNIHGDKYNYEKVVFVNTKTKVCIICPEHGEFWQIPETHMKGSGCPKCAVDKNKKITKREKLTKEQFIEKANIIHNNKYNYDKSNYINKSNKIIITCPEHGDFKQSPHHHLQGQGCPKCANKIRNKISFTLNDFLIKAQEIHGNKYDYSKVINPKYNTKVTIICPIHGEFQQSVNSHLTDCGCPQCSKNKLLTNKEFLKRANKIHNNKYIYKTNYKNSRGKILITCPIHGDFEQVANIHLNGSGCPKCSESHGEKLIRNLLENLNVCYEYQKHLNLNLNNKLIIVDFYIEYKDKIYIIEYNGKQHYESVDYFGGEEAFKRQQLRDNLLEKYCELNNIQLIVLTYNQNENDIEFILNSYFKEF